MTAYSPTVPSRRLALACLAVACLLLLGGVLLVLDNPAVTVSASDVEDSGPAGEVVCSIAPWDAGLNDNRDGPGGEHSPTYSREVADQCYAANMTRFDAAVASGVLALITLGAAVAVAVRSRRSSPPEAGGADVRARRQVRAPRPS